MRATSRRLTALNYGDALNTEIDAEIKAIEEAAALAEEEEAEGATDLEAGAAELGDMPDDTGVGSEEDIDLGSLDSLTAEAFEHSGNDILLEEQEFDNSDAIVLTEDDLPSPSDLDTDIDFTDNY